MQKIVLKVKAISIWLKKSFIFNKYGFRLSKQKPKHLSNSSAWFSPFLQSLMTLTVTRQHLPLGAFSPLGPLLHPAHWLCLVFKHLSAYWDDFFQQGLTEHLLHGRHCDVVKPKKFLLMVKATQQCECTWGQWAVQLNMVKIVCFILCEFYHNTKTF